MSWPVCLKWQMVPVKTKPWGNINLHYFVPISSISGLHFFFPNFRLLLKKQLQVGVLPLNTNEPIKTTGQVGFTSAEANNSASFWGCFHPILLNKTCLYWGAMHVILEYCIHKKMSTTLRQISIPTFSLLPCYFYILAFFLFFYLFPCIPSLRSY